MVRVPYQERFWKYVDKRDSCWLWTSARLKGRGYGLFWVSPFQVYAHRVSWELHFGKIPTDLDVLHHCDNPPCVNPSHLFLGTAHENMKDCWSKGRHPGNGGGYGTSGVYGVVQAGDKWKGVIHTPKQICVGYYATVAEAKEAVEAYRREHRFDALHHRH